jgi:uncharacterized phage protein (TIGR01671 family)
MNREIKFRVWDTLTKKMVDTGFHVIGEVTVFGLIDQYAQENKGDRKCSLERYNDFVLMQWVGLKDKKKKDVYEGDIVYAEANGVRYIVKFGEYVSEHAENDNDTEWGFYVERIHGKSTESISEANLWLEVIGNIFENPELIKTVKE